jgi:hypothetical protein
VGCPCMLAGLAYTCKPAKRWRLACILGMRPCLQSGPAARGTRGPCRCRNTLMCARAQEMPHLLPLPSPPDAFRVAFGGWLRLSLKNVAGDGQITAVELVGESRAHRGHAAHHVLICLSTMCVQHHKHRNARHCGIDTATLKTRAFSLGLLHKQGCRLALRQALNACHPRLQDRTVFKVHMAPMSAF